MVNLMKPGSEIPESWKTVRQMCLWLFAMIGRFHQFKSICNLTLAMTMDFHLIFLIMYCIKLLVPMREYMHRFYFQL